MNQNLNLAILFFLIFFCVIILIHPYYFLAVSPKKIRKPKDATFEKLCRYLGSQYLIYTLNQLSFCCLFYWWAFFEKGTTRLCLCFRRSSYLFVLFTCNNTYGINELDWLMDGKLRILPHAFEWFICYRTSLLFDYSDNTTKQTSSYIDTVFIIYKCISRMLFHLCTSFYWNFPSERSRLVHFIRSTWSSKIWMGHLHKID